MDLKKFKARDGVYYLLVERVGKNEAICSCDYGEQRELINLPLARLEALVSDKLRIGRMFEMKIEKGEILLKALNLPPLTYSQIKQVSYYRS